MERFNHWFWVHGAGGLFCKIKWMLILSFPHTLSIFQCFFAARIFSAIFQATFPCDRESNSPQRWTKCTQGTSFGCSTAWATRLQHVYLVHFEDLSLLWPYLRRIQFAGMVVRICKWRYTVAAKPGVLILKAKIFHLGFVSLICFLFYRSGFESSLRFVKADRLHIQPHHN